MCTFQSCLKNLLCIELFHIVAEGPERGELYLTSELDYEKMTEITFEVCATNPSEPTSANPTATQTLTVSVTNVNDNAPNCVSCPVAVNVDENAGTGNKTLQFKTKEFKILKFFLTLSLFFFEGGSSTLIIV